MIHSPFLRYVPLTELATPKTGYEVMVDHWWIVDPEKGAVFYQRNQNNKEDLGAPQCNRDKNVTELVHSRIYKDMEIRQIPLAYLRRNYDG